MRYLVSILLVFGFAAAAQAQTAPGDLGAASAPQPVDKTSQAEDVNFKTEAYDRMTVPVTLSGSGPYRFLVDTGADRTAVSHELASKLQLVAGDSAQVHSVGGVLTVPTATIPQLQLTRKAVKIVDAPLLYTANMGADGIIGTDTLRSQRVEFDFTKQTMEVVPASSPQLTYEPGMIVIEARRRNGRLIVTDAVADGRNLTVVVDTGAQISIGNQALRDALSSHGLSSTSEPIELLSVTGETITGDYMFVKDLKLKGIELKNLAVVFANAHTFKQLKLNDKPALLLGMNALRAFKKVSIDFANRQFRVVVPESSERDVRMASVGR